MDIEGKGVGVMDKFKKWWELYESYMLSGHETITLDDVEDAVKTAWQEVTKQRDAQYELMDECRLQNCPDCGKRPTTIIDNILGGVFIECLGKCNFAIVFGRDYNEARTLWNLLKGGNKMTEAINIIFDGPPSKPGKFIEVETDGGESIKIGEWIVRGDGSWALRITSLPKSHE